MARLLLLAVAFAVVVGAGAAATAPTVITGPVDAVGATTATVSGTVNPNGTATTWYLEYGKTTTYGTKTPRRAPLRDRHRRVFPRT